MANPHPTYHAPVAPQADERACSWCGEVKPATPEFFYAIPDGRRGAGGIRVRGVCRMCLKKQNRAANARLRLAALTYYSDGAMACACCGESHLEFLAIDHIEGGGHKHRQTLGSNSIYRWLRDQRFPAGFRVLCHNCNLARGFYGACPHEAIRRRSMIGVV